MTDRRRLRAEAKATVRAERAAAAEAKRAAKELARAERLEARERADTTEARARADGIAARRAARVDTMTAELEPPAVDEPAEPGQSADIDGSAEIAQPVEPGRPEDVPAHDDRAEVRLAARREREAAREARVAAKEASRRARIEARDAARRARGARGGDDDHIVEPPRGVEVSRRDRRREERARDRPGSPAAGRRVVTILAGVVGVAALLCSVVLAVGALLVALGQGSGDGVFDTVSDVCDVLAGPLKDVFTFSGTNAAQKQALVGWGAGSMVYLVVFWVTQSFFGSRGAE